MAWLESSGNLKQVLNKLNPNADSQLLVLTADATVIMMVRI